MFKSVINCRARQIGVVFLLSLTVLLVACGGGGGGGGTASSSGWTWTNGSNMAEQTSSYGTQGMASASNDPGGRIRTVNWVDASGNLWLFGGFGVDSTGTSGKLNDLWRWDGSQWTWISGGNTVDQAGSYGTQGTAASSNVPGARISAVSWVDASDNLWLFGGRGLDSAGTSGDLNDLWRWDGSQWTWISGSNTVDQAGSYGTQGTAASSNVPGARISAVSWVDAASSDLCLFGGFGYDGTDTVGYDVLNDLWCWNGSQWTWISGSNTVDQAGSYGTQGTAASSNVPGGRENATGWLDVSGNLWLFGGNGNAGGGLPGRLNDLWRWDGSQWTWMSGSDTAKQAGSYGTQGTASASNVPGGRSGAASWLDASGNLWLFGGVGHDSAASEGRLNDLWRWDGSQWTWMGGSDTVKQAGSYGAQGTASASNVPGARYGAVSWVDASGNFRMFGGSGYDSAGTLGMLNDLWRYQP